MGTTDRRTFLWLAGGGALAGLLAEGCTREPPPNVLFIVVDDLNDWVGCLGGHPDSRTPNLDRLAARGTLFSNAHCTSPNCGGSRTSVLTGLQPSTTGVYATDQHFRTRFPDHVTLPQHFRAHGYRVLGGGKVFHLQDDPSWDEFFEAEPSPLIDNRSHGRDLRWGAVEADEADMIDPQLARWAGRVLADAGQQPLFLALGFFRPHPPWLVPQSYLDRFPPSEVTLPQVLDDDFRDLPRPARFRIRSRDHRIIVNRGLWHQAVAAYLASVNFFDVWLGRVLDSLDSSPLGNNTIVVLWSDHGFHLGEKGHWRKFHLWEESTRVPLIVTGPGIAPGVCQRAVSLIGLYPTLVDLCGLERRTDLDAESLRRWIVDPAAPRERPALTCRGAGNWAIRDDHWRYIRWVDGSEELYDHRDDPNEWRNLAEHEESAPIKSRLAAWIPTDVAPPVEGR